MKDIKEIENMKILFTGDSITDMSRNRTTNYQYDSLGFNYTFFIAGELGVKEPNKHQILTRGISGNRIIDLYARFRADGLHDYPDVISILIGVNDVWHGIASDNGVPIDIYERFYNMLIDDTRREFPHIKFMILEPFVLKGTATEERFEQFKKVYEYAKVARKVAKEKGCVFVPLQQLLSEKAEQDGAQTYLYDGVHPSVAGAKLIADEWLKYFEKEVNV